MAPSSAGIAILLPLTIGIAVIVGTIIIHALALVTIVHFIRREQKLGRGRV